ncbi:MAG: hypothetical protein U0X20_02015 [Caldilineaceae bacterium]
MTVYIAYLADEQAGAPTGVRIVEPPPDTHQAQRGNFYALVDLQGLDDAAVLTERILSAMQRTYYTTKGTQSQVLTDTMRSAQQLVEAEYAKRSTGWRVGVICIGLMSDRLAIAGMGDAFAFVTTDNGGVNVYPPDRLSAASNLDDPFALWPLHRQKVESGGALIAGGAEWLDRVSPRTLASAAAFVTPESCQDAADGLREQAGVTDIPGLLLVFSWGDDDAVAAPAQGAGGSPAVRPAESPPSAPGSPSANSQPAGSSGVSSAAKAAAVYAAANSPPAGPPQPAQSQPGPPQAGSPGIGPAAAGTASRARSGAGLPTALNATPPVVSAPDVPPSASYAAAAAVTTAATAASRPLAAAPPSAAEAPLPAAPPPAPAQGPPPLPLAAAESTTPGPRMPAVLAAGAITGLNRARGMFASILPDRNAQSAPNPWAGPAAEAVVIPRAAGSSKTFVPPPAATGSRARLFIAIAVILLLLVPAVVAGMYWQQGASNRSEAESLLDLAQARLLSAQDALDQEDKSTARGLLTEAYDYVLQSEEILGRTTRSGDLIEQIRSEQQQVMQITPLYGLTAPLATFPADASPQRVQVIDQDVYVMDTGRGEVTKYRLDASGETLADQGQVVLQEGDVVNGVTVGSLVDMAWQSPIPGYEDKASLLLLDGNNRVFRYNSVDGSTLISFGDPSPWQKASQLEVFSDRLYVADEAANQIYRYAPGTYQDPPVPWFQPTTQVSLQGTEALRIDGDIWLLFSDGKVVRYHAGEQVPFSLDDSVALPADPVDLYVSQSVNDPSLYLADAAEERILFFDKGTGEFQGQFQAAEGRPLRGLRSIYIDEVRGTLFILTNEALYVQRLPR